MAVGTESQKTPVALPAARDQAGFFLSDRATPSHLRAVSIAFCVFSVAAILATILSTSILFELLALQAQSHLFPVLLLGASIPVLAYFILDWFHARALGGFRFARVAHQTLVFAVFGSVFSVALCLVHPALGVASLIAAVLSFLTLRLFIWLDWRESVWDFTAEEATSILAGRDTVGRNLADSWKQTHSIVDSVFAALLIMNFVATSAVASWLSGRDVLDPAGVLPLAVLAPWATFGIQRWLRLHFQPTDKQSATLKSTLDFERPNGDADDVWAKGLVVQDLRASDAAGDLLLHNISFHLPPGRVIGLRGDHGSGRSEERREGK